MTEQTNSDRIRAHIKAHGPIGPRELAATLGLRYAIVWGLARPMVKRGILLADEQGRYTHGRDANPRTAKRADPAQRAAAERERLRNRDQKAERARRKGVTLIANKAQRTRDFDQRRAEIASLAQFAQTKQMGFRETTAPVRLMTSDEWAANGGVIERVPAYWELAA